MIWGIDRSSELSLGGIFAPCMQNAFILAFLHFERALLSSSLDERQDFNLAR